MSRAGVIRSKAIIRRIHKWIGLCLALYLVLQSITGVLLLYRHELQASWSQSGRTGIDSGEIVSIQRVLERIDTVYPHLTVDRIYYPEVPGEPYIAHLSGGASGAARLVEIDPSSGRVYDASAVIRLLEAVFDLELFTRQRARGVQEREAAD